MHNYYIAMLAKLLNICERITDCLVNEYGNCLYEELFLNYQTLEVVALFLDIKKLLVLTVKSLLFAKLQEYRVLMPNLILPPTIL